MRNALDSKAGIFILALVLLTASPLAMAQATRTWVSGVGDDVNPCSRTAPCKTYAGAISKTAAGGVINTLDPGGFGAVTITKSITITGGGDSGGGILSTATNGIVINAGANDVVNLINLNIDGSPGSGLNGIRILNAGTVNVRDVRIDAMRSAVPNGRGINVANSAGVLRLNLDNVTITNSLGGVLLAPTGTGSVVADISNSSFSGNTNGIRLAERTTVSMHNTVVTGNGSNGIVVFGSAAGPAFLSIDNSQVTSNGTVTPGTAGISVEGAQATAWVSDVLITDNPIGFRSTGGAALVSFNNNKVAGNDVDGTATSIVTTR